MKEQVSVVPMKAHILDAAHKFFANWQMDEAFCQTDWDNVDKDSNLESLFDNPGNAHFFEHLFDDRPMLPVEKKDDMEPFLTPVDEQELVSASDWIQGGFVHVRNSRNFAYKDMPLTMDWRFFAMLPHMDLNAYGNIAAALPYVVAFALRLDESWAHYDLCVALNDFWIEQAKERGIA